MDCFSCYLCGEMLRKGYYYGLYQSEVYCEKHFRHLTESNQTAPSLDTPINQLNCESDIYQGR